MLQTALDLLRKQSNRVDVVRLALDAERRSVKAKKLRTQRDWLTVANLLIVAFQDERPFLQGNEPPPWELKPDPENPDMPF